jgi:hypothetical protein
MRSSEKISLSGNELCWQQYKNAPVIITRKIRGFIN